VQCMGLVFACCICVQVVYIAELKQSVSASSSSRCSWLHLLRPLLINSGRTRLCILDPEIHLVAGREILRCEVVRGCPPILLLDGVFISVTWLPDFSTSYMMKLFIWLWVMKLPFVGRKCVSFLTLPVLLFVLVCVCYLVLSCCGVIV
jgi:hypothetical protein